MAELSEDYVYRTSTQYKLWSFTEDELAKLRASTNSLAAVRVKEAIRRSQSSNGAANGGPDGKEIDCLSVEEEQKLVNYYCATAMGLCDFCEFPTNVKATAVQYLKRFYLSNSPMTYHPKQMTPCAIFLATKTDNYYISLKNFAAKLKDTTQEDVVAPEFLLSQGLRFTFDVRHPHRGLEGGFMLLQDLASGNFHPPAGVSVSAAQLRSQMMELPAENDRPKAVSTKELQSRIQQAHGKAKEILKTSAILSDAYFLYTPPQIWLAAFLIADKLLAEFYVGSILIAAGDEQAGIQATLQACVELLATSRNAEEAERKEAKRIDKKLYHCRNPEKIDLAGINQAQKRNGENAAGGLIDEKTAKKRKLEREHAAKEEDPFGPSIGK